MISKVVSPFIYSSALFILLLYLFLCRFLAIIQSSLGLSIFTELEHKTAPQEIISNTKTPGFEETGPEERSDGSESRNTVAAGFLPNHAPCGAFQ